MRDSRSSQRSVSTRAPLGLRQVAGVGARLGSPPVRWRPAAPARRSRARDPRPRRRWGASPPGHISRRPSRACDRVTSSAYSRSPPTGRPDASRVTRTPERLQQRRHVHRRGVALQVRVGGQDDLADVVAVDPLQQLLDTQVLGADAVERADGATQDVEAPLDEGGLLDAWRRPWAPPPRTAGCGRATRRGRPGTGRPSATLPHSRQNEMRSLACTMTAARRLASSGGALTSQNARRCADFGPTPGSRASSSMSSWMGPSYATAQSSSTGWAPSISWTRRSASASSGTSLLLDQLHDGRLPARLACFPHDARDHGLDAEQIVQRVPQAVLPRRHLLRADPCGPEGTPARSFRRRRTPRWRTPGWL